MAIVATHLVFVGSWKHFGATSGARGYPLIESIEPSSALGLGAGVFVPTATVASATAATNARNGLSAIFNDVDASSGPPTVADINFGHFSSPSGELPNGYE